MGKGASILGSTPRVVGAIIDQHVESSTDKNLILYTPGNISSEVDPDFNTWDKSTGISITQFQVTDGITTFASIISTIGATQTTLIVNTPQTITGDVTVPSTLTLEIRGGGSFTIAITKTLTINGPFNAPLKQVFYGTGTVTLSTTSVKELMPQWFGNTLKYDYRIPGTSTYNFKNGAIIKHNQDATVTINGLINYIPGQLITIIGVTGYTSSFTLDSTIMSSGVSFIIRPGDIGIFMLDFSPNEGKLILLSYYSPIPVTLVDSATPSIVNMSTVLTGGTTTITNLTGGIIGQVIRILSEHAITITDGTNIFLSGSANFVMASGDTLTLVQKSNGKWYELSRGDN